MLNKSGTYRAFPRASRGEGLEGRFSGVARAVSAQLEMTSAARACESFSAHGRATKITLIMNLPPYPKWLLASLSDWQERLRKSTARPKTLIHIDDQTFTTETEAARAHKVSLETIKLWIASGKAQCK